MEAFETWLEGRSPLGRTADAAMRLVDWGLVGFALTDWIKRRPLLPPYGYHTAGAWVRHLLLRGSESTAAPCRRRI